MHIQQKFVQVPNVVLSGVLDLENVFKTFKCKNKSQKILSKFCLVVFSVITLGFS
jgi:hypothetical protein